MSTSIRITLFAILGSLVVGSCILAIREARRASTRTEDAPPESVPSPSTNANVDLHPARPEGSFAAGGTAQFELPLKKTHDWLKGQSLEKNDIWEDIWDLDRYTSSLLAQQSMEKRAEESIALVKTDIRQAGGRWIHEHLLSARPESMALLGVQWIEPEREAVVVVRQSQTVRGERRIYHGRWWMIKRGEFWKVYDYEDLRVGGRLSADHAMHALMIADRIDPNSARGHELQKSLRDIKSCADELRASKDNEGLSGATAQLLAPDTMPPEWRPRVRALRAAAFGLGSFMPDEALAELDQLVSTAANSPTMQAVRCRACILNKDYAGAEESGKKYVTMVGPEAVVSSNRGVALFRLKRGIEAAEQFALALDDSPDSPGYIDWLRRCLPDDRKAELIPRLKGLADPKTARLTLVDRAKEEGDFRGAEVLLQGKTAGTPKTPGEYAELIRLRLDEKKPKDALNLLVKAIEVQGTKETFSGPTTLIVPFVDSGLSAEAYHAVPKEGRRWVFQVFPLSIAMSQGEDLISKEFIASVRKLVEIHSQNDAKDAWLPFVRGWLAERADNRDEAERQYAEGMKNELDRFQKTAYEIFRLNNLVSAGHPLKAYEVLGSNERIFGDVAAQLKEKPEALQQLIAAHRKNHEKDRYLDFHSARAAFALGRFAEAATSYAAFRDQMWGKNPPQNEIDEAANSIVRCYVRLKEFAKAKTEALVAKRVVEYSKGISVLAAAADSDVPGTLKEIEEVVKTNSNFAIYMYKDADLGPLLKAERFASVRRKYPPPEE